MICASVSSGVVWCASGILKKHSFLCSSERERRMSGRPWSSLNQGRCIWRVQVSPSPHDPGLSSSSLPLCVSRPDALLHCVMCSLFCFGLECWRVLWCFVCRRLKWLSFGLVWANLKKVQWFKAEVKTWGKSLHSEQNQYFKLLS